MLKRIMEILKLIVFLTAAAVVSTLAHSLVQDGYFELSGHVPKVEGTLANAGKDFAPQFSRFCQE